MLGFFYNMEFMLYSDTGKILTWIQRYPIYYRFSSEIVTPFNTKIRLDFSSEIRLDAGG